MYILNVNSKTAKFYSWIWNTDVSKFKTMCPYFWKYVLTILFIPLILISKFLYWVLPGKKKLNVLSVKISETKLSKKIVKSTNYVMRKNTFWNVVGKILKYIYFTIIGLTILLAIFMFGYLFYYHNIKVLAVIGGFTLFILFIMYIFHIDETTKIRSNLVKPFKFLGNMFYSLYKNMCPIVIWDK